MKVFRLIAAAGTIAAMCSVMPATATGATGGIISFRLEAEPGPAESTAVTLQLDGTDMSTACGAVAPDGFVTCTGLPDGTYDIVMSGVPAGMRTAVNCVDIVAARALRPRIEVGNGFTQWQCTAFVGTPAVVLSVGATSNATVDGVSLELAPVDGLIVDCVADTINGGAPAERCRDLPLGEYRAITVGALAGSLSSLSCGPLIFDESLLYVSAPTQDRAELTDSSWLWWCDASGFGPTAFVELIGDAAHDVAAALATVTGDAGPVGEACSRVFGDAGLVSYDCFLTAGVYEVNWQNLPAGDVPDETCSTFQVLPDAIDAVACTSSYLGPVEETVPAGGSGGGGVEEPAAEPASTLPSTGRDTGRASALAGLLIVAGAALVAATRRPRCRAD